MSFRILPDGNNCAIPIGNLPFGTSGYDVDVPHVSQKKSWSRPVQAYLEEIQRRRRERLNEYIASCGGQKDAIAKIGKEQAQLSQLSTGKKPIGEALARDIEERIGKPFGWLDGHDAPAHKSTTKSLPEDAIGRKLMALWPQLSVAYRRELYGRAAGYLRRRDDDEAPSRRTA